MSCPLRTQLNKMHLGLSNEVDLLIKVCGQLALSKEQKLHLLAKVFYDPDALVYWADLYREDSQKGEQYLVCMAPLRSELQTGDTASVPPPAGLLATLKVQFLRVVTPLARAIGLM